MRRVILILCLPCWTAAQALAAGCPMTGAPAPAAPESASHQHHDPTPAHASHQHHDHTADHPPTHQSAECGMAIQCNVAGAPSGGYATLAAPTGGRGAPIHPLAPHEAPDITAEPPPPRSLVP